MSKEDAKVRRTLHLRFTLPSGDSGQFAAMIKAAVTTPVTTVKAFSRTPCVTRVVS